MKWFVNGLRTLTARLSINCCFVSRRIVESYKDDDGPTIGAGFPYDSMIIVACSCRVFHDSCCRGGNNR
jgi:hypothetical protein